MEGRVPAASGIPDAADGLVRAAALANPVGGGGRQDGLNGDMPDVRSLRIPLKYLANLLTAGNEEPVALALERMLAMRGYMRAKTVDGGRRAHRRQMSASPAAPSTRCTR